MVDVSKRRRRPKGTPDGGEFARENKAEAARDLAADPFTAAGSETWFDVCADHDEWLERRRMTPGCSDARAVLMEGHVSPPLDVEPGSFLESVLTFGHEWEPRIAAEYARREGFEQVADDTPIGELKPGQLTRHELGMIERDGIVHASLDAVQRERDGSVTIVEIKTGGRASFDRLKPEQAEGYLAQADVERLVAGADRARIVYAQRPYRFDTMNAGELESAVLGSMDTIEVDAERMRPVRLADGSSLADLDLGRLEEACRRAL